MRLLWLTAAFAALCLQPLRAEAVCYTGGTPDWGDVQEVEVDRCQPVNNDYPCYYALLASGQRGIDGYIVAYRLSGRNGTYVLDSSKTSLAPWQDALTAVKDADFFSLTVSDPTPGPGAVTAYIDGPYNRIVLHRCHVLLAIDANGTYDKTSQGYVRFMSLIDHLDKIIEALPWQKKNDKATMSDVWRHFVP
jgi:hypothetical protein